jgi:hypothetical protein
VTKLLGALLKRIFARGGDPAGVTATSLSDNNTYAAACLRAATDPASFENFRRDPAYTRILEHVSAPLGQAYLDLITRDSQVMSAMDAFKRNDHYGNPQLYDYPVVGSVSPSTLRYIKVLVDLKEHFETLDGLRICEIGVGYGGQCRVIHAGFKPAAYCLVDLDPALELARRYLENFAVGSELSFKSMKELESSDHDLVISNYAFTELARPIQEVYLSKVILRSKRGYITYNEVTPAAFESFRSDELVGIIPGSKIIAERPLTHAKNCIILWGEFARDECAPRPAKGSGDCDID